jgi:hypothetical protein
MVAAMHRFPNRLLAYCLVPIHRRRVFRPRKDGKVTAQYGIAAQECESRIFGP